MDEYEAARYDEAVPHYRKAAEEYAVADALFGEAVSRARERGYDRAEAVVSDASIHCTHIGFVADLYARAAVHRAHGEQAAAEADIEDAEVHRKQAAEAEVATVESFAGAVRAHDGD